MAKDDPRASQNEKREDGVHKDAKAYVVKTKSEQKIQYKEKKRLKEENRESAAPNVRRIEKKGRTEKWWQATRRRKEREAGRCQLEEKQTKKRRETSPRASLRASPCCLPLVTRQPTSLRRSSEFLLVSSLLNSTC